MYLLKQDKHTEKRSEKTSRSDFLFIYIIGLFCSFCLVFYVFLLVLYGTIYPNLSPPQTQTHTQKNPKKTKQTPQCFSPVLS